MKILFVTVPAPSHLQTWYMPLGLAYLTSYLHKTLPDVEVEVCDYAQGESPFLHVPKSQPDIIGFTSTTMSFGKCVETAEKIKRIYPIPMVVGGTHISALPHTLPKVFDVGVIGEGERTFVQLFRRFTNKFNPLTLKQTAGICFHHHNQVVVKKNARIIKPLDDIPFPDREIFNLKQYYLKSQNHFPTGYGVGLNVMTSRGCPYRCVFCQSCRFWREVRFHSPEYVAEELCLLRDRYHVKFITFLDDIFHLNVKRLRCLVKEIRKHGLHEEIQFSVQGHAGLFNDEIAKLLKQMGVRYIGFGLESGSPKILKFLKRGVVTVEDNIKAVQLAKLYGFKVGSGFMYGVPGETKEDVEANFQFTHRFKLDSFSHYLCTPLPSTPLWNYALKKGLVSEDMDWTKINQFGEKPLLTGR